MSDDILRPECVKPSDLVNTGVKCSECGSSKVVYCISVTPPFPLGAKCYKCLLKLCKLHQRIPIPISVCLANALESDLGLTKGKVTYFFIERGSPS